MHVATAYCLCIRPAHACTCTWTLCAHYPYMCWLVHGMDIHGLGIWYQVYGWVFGTDTQSNDMHLYDLLKSHFLWLHMHVYCLHIRSMCAYYPCAHIALPCMHVRTAKCLCIRLVHACTWGSCTGNLHMCQLVHGIGIHDLHIQYQVYSCVFSTNTLSTYVDFHDLLSSQFAWLHMHVYCLHIKPTCACCSCAHIRLQ